jgi:hypothetical protein
MQQVVQTILKAPEVLYNLEIFLFYIQSKTFCLKEHRARILMSGRAQIMICSFIARSYTLPTHDREKYSNKPLIMINSENERESAVL